MIVRISGEDQYRLGDADGERLRELEIPVSHAVDSGDEQGFEKAYAELLAHVRSRGERLGDDELEGSDVILPPGDTTFAEAAGDFTGEGLIPD